MLTRDDIKKLVEVFATKQDLQQVREEMATKDQLNDAMNKLDAVYGELKDFRQEQTVHVYQHGEINKRLAKLESVVKD